MLSEKEKFNLANDFDFSFAVWEAEAGRRPLTQWSFQRIGDRIRLIDELEKAGFSIVKTKTLANANNMS